MGMKSEITHENNHTNKANPKSEPRPLDTRKPLSQDKVPERPKSHP